MRNCSIFFLDDRPLSKDQHNPKYVLPWLFFSCITIRLNWVINGIILHLHVKRLFRLILGWEQGIVSKVFFLHFLIIFCVNFYCLLPPLSSIFFVLYLCHPLSIIFWVDFQWVLGLWLGFGFGFLMDFRFLIGFFIGF